MFWEDTLQHIRRQFRRQFEYTHSNNKKLKVNWKKRTITKSKIWIKMTDVNDVQVSVDGSKPSRPAPGQIIVGPSSTAPSSERQHHQPEIEQLDVQPETSVPKNSLPEESTESLDFKRDFSNSKSATKDTAPTNTLTLNFSSESENQNNQNNQQKLPTKTLTVTTDENLDRASMDSVEKTWIALDGLQIGAEGAEGEGEYSELKPCIV